MVKNKWIVFGILLMSFLSGCSDKQELTELGMIGAVAYDMQAEQTTVMMDILQKDSAEMQMVSGVGPGCQEAYEAANEKLDRQLYPSHICIHLFGETYARQGLQEMSDMVLRDQSFRGNVPMLVVRDNTAMTVLQQAAKQDGVESENLYRLLHENAGLGRTTETTVLEFVKQSKTTGMHPLIGCIKTQPTENGAMEVSCSGSAIFSENQLIGYLDEKQTLICQLLRGVPIQTSIYLNKSGTSVKIENVKTKRQADKQHAKVFITLRVSVTGKRNTMDTEAILQETQEELQQVVLQTVQEVQQLYEIDIFGFGKELRDKELQQAQWDQMFAKMPVDVQIETRLKTAGQVVN